VARGPEHSVLPAESAQYRAFEYFLSFRLKFCAAVSGYSDEGRKKSEVHMRKFNFFHFLTLQPSRTPGTREIGLIAVLGIAATLFATPPVGFVVNQILAKGTTFENISEHVQMAKNLDGTVDPWQVQLQAQGTTDTYAQHLVLAPGGYSGWHRHPGVLVATVAAGEIDFYDANCNKRSFTAGQVYFEDADPHAIINRGSVNADLYIAYLIKHDAPRRIEADAPVCAPLTGIP